MSHAPIGASHLDPTKPRRRRTVPRAHHLLRLALAAIRSAPKRPFISRADGVQRIPELGRNAGIRRILHHADALTMLDLPPNLAAELKVISTVINRPRTVGLHQHAMIGRSDQLLQSKRLLARQQTDIGHANHRQAVPALGAERSTRACLTNGVCSFARAKIASK